MAKSLRSSANFHIIVNPVSGYKKGMEILSKVTQQLKDSNVFFQSFVTEQMGHACNLAERLSYEGVSGIVVIGGDGTMHEVINGMLKRTDGQRIPIGLIPAGTGNSLVHDLGLLDVTVATEAVIKGKTQMLDIAKVNCPGKIIYCFNVLAWGVPADANIRAEGLRIFKSTRYNIAAIIEILRNKGRRVCISFEDKVLEGNFSFIVACNTKHTGNGMIMAPDAKINDGFFDLLTIKKIGRIGLFKLFLKVFKGNHLPHSHISYNQLSTFKIDTASFQPLIIDGEITGSTPCTIQVLSNKIEIFSLL